MASFKPSDLFLESVGILEQDSLLIELQISSVSELVAHLTIGNSHLIHTSWYFTWIFSSFNFRIEVPFVLGLGFALPMVS